MWRQWLHGRVHSELVWRAWWVSWCCGGVQHGHGDGCVHLVECDVVGVCDDDDVQECAVELGQPYDGCGFVGWVVCGDCVLPLLRVSDLWRMLCSLCGCVCWMRTLRSSGVLHTWLCVHLRVRMLCRYVTCLLCLPRSADAGCVASGGVTPLLFGVVSPTIFKDSHFRYFKPTASNGISDMSSGWFFKDTSWTYDPRTRPWYEKGSMGGGVTAAFKVVGVGSATLMARSYTSPIWASNGGLAGVFTSNTLMTGENKCTNGCRTNSNAARVVGSASAMLGVNLTAVERMASFEDMSAVAKVLYQSYVSTRASVSSPSMGLGTENGWYIEVISCADYGSADSGCNAAPGAANLICMVSADIWGTTDFQYFKLANEQGDLASTAPFFTVPGPYVVTGGCSAMWFGVCCD